LKPWVLHFTLESALPLMSSVMYALLSDLCCK
jgi:hypothetical protein